MLKKLQKIYNDFLNDCIEGIQDHQFPGKSKEWIEGYIENYSPEGREENTVREAGYLAGLQKAIDILSYHTENKGKSTQ